ncbi:MULTISPECIES: DUF427 domain-containing protein [unclassified Leeuwenhoekiella]|uniref:DUF427 domain-containing protein n=1 Tax=unclassified Leeuwenhoekiella TaxID=2615029 RepID=UPI000C5124A7|nr:MULTISPECIES: DUF427 domain-containing protein [unclassified Leeuwenhoekiella]MAW94164.1 hypothetical protein [Leeuwenhoekiella sp.]MAW96218.1 hypothetical protein [Leeuwenhoekiella sp.]MBA80212.1 hypothetical protein [Leeuwenhoekiella sp.]|tara:strand:+ start:1312 stop:1872 length:561 start_codon:yes stop_codon:yes gene_type:complete
MRKERKVPEWLKKSRESWSNTGEKRPPFATVPKDGQRSVWDFPRPPAIEKVNKPVLVKYDDHILAESKNALMVLETASPPTYYIPNSDIDTGFLVKMEGRTSMCEWKGSASYWALKINPSQPIAWLYPNPFTEFEALKDHIAFYPQNLECFVDGERVEAQPGAFYAGWITPDLTGPFKGEKGTEHW